MMAEEELDDKGDAKKDDEGNEYFEVDFLSNDVIYKSISNKESDNTSVANSLRPFIVPRRFIY